MSGGVMVAARGWCGVPGVGWRRLDVEGLDDAAVAVVLADAAVGARVSTVYVLDGAPPAAGVVTVTGGDPGDGSTWRVRVCSGGGGREVTIVWPALDAGRVAGMWDGLGPRELLDVFGAFERLVGVPWSVSIGRTAERLILSTHPRRAGGRRLDEPVELPEAIADNTVELPWAAWRRELTRGEQQAAWVHVFDARSQYLSAWSAAELGMGTPLHRTSGVRFEASTAGFWRMPDLGGMASPDPLLPAPWLPHREWFSTPTIVRALEVLDGFSMPLPVEAWVWPARSRYLRGAAERLRDARSAAVEAVDAAAAVLGDPDATEAAAWAAVGKRVTAEAVLDAVKSLYRVETGRFGMPRPAPSAWYRPDWGHTIRAVARCNLHRRLAQLGARPVAIATDALVFVDDEPDPVEFALRIRLPLGTGLGHYSIDATAPHLGDVATATIDGATVRVLFDTIAKAAGR